MEEAETVGSELWLPIKLNKSLHIPGTAEERVRVPALPETKCSGVILLFSVLTCMREGEHFHREVRRLTWQTMLKLFHDANGIIEVLKADQINAHFKHTGI